MKTKLRSILCAALALGATAATLSAQMPGASPVGAPADAPPPPHRHHGPPPSPLFLALDANGDGVISAEEIANAPAALQALADASGRITRDALRPPRPAKDDQRPGDEQPWPRHHPPSDQNGPASGPQPPSPPPSGERAQCSPPPDVEHGRRKPDAAPAPDAVPNGPVRHHHGPPHGDRLSDTLDANNDGVLSSEEIEAAASALKKADANNDGVIDHRDLRPPPPPPPAPVN